LKFTALVQSNINSADGGFAVPTKEPQKRIKGCSRIRIQQRFAQARAAHRAAKEEFLVISGVAKPQFPIPTLKIIPKFAHLTAKSDVEQNVVKSSLVRSEWLIINGAIADTGSYWDRNTVMDQSRIGRSEWIKRVLDRHTEPDGAKGSTARKREWIR